MHFLKKFVMEFSVEQKKVLKMDSGVKLHQFVCFVVSTRGTQGSTLEKNGGQLAPKF